MESEWIGFSDHISNFLDSDWPWWICEDWIRIVLRIPVH